MLTPFGQSAGWRPWRPTAGSNKRPTKRDWSSRPVRYILYQGCRKLVCLGTVGLWIVVTRREECGSEMRLQLCMAGDSRALGYTFAVGKQFAHWVGCGGWPASWAPRKALSATHHDRMQDHETASCATAPYRCSAQLLVATW
jgi:hypothetical protein